MSDPADQTTCALPTDGERGGHHHHADNGQVCWEDDGCDGDLATVTGCAASQTGAVLATDQCRGCDYQTAPVGAPCPVCESLARVSDHVITWNTRDSTSLAQSLLSTDWAAINEALPNLADHMVWALRTNAAEVRAGRVPLFQFDDNDPLSVADIADLSQRLFTVFEVVGRFGKAMTTVSKEALAEIAVDAEETKLGRVVIPTSPGGPSIVAARERTVETTFDDTRILAVIAEMAVLSGEPTAEDMVGITGRTPADVADPEDARTAYLAGLRAGARYGAQFAIDMRRRADWKITAIKALGADAMANGKFKIAAVIERAFSQKTVDGDYKVTIENR